MESPDLRSVRYNFRGGDRPLPITNRVLSDFRNYGDNPLSESFDDSFEYSNSPTF
jgi:hypothetical protein